MEFFAATDDEYRPIEGILADVTYTSLLYKSYCLERQVLYDLDRLENASVVSLTRVLFSFSSFWQSRKED